MQPRCDDADRGPLLPVAPLAERRELLTSVAERVDLEQGDNFLGLVLSGSAGRGMATERSDVDVMVVLEEVPDGSSISKSPTIDEAPIALGDLDELPRFGTDGWWYRWSYAGRRSCSTGRTAHCPRPYGDRRPSPRRRPTPS